MDANAEEVKHEYGIDLKEKISIGDYDGIVLAVAHNEFKEILNANTLSSSQVIYDVKSILPKELVTARL